VPQAQPRAKQAPNISRQNTQTLFAIIFEATTLIKQSQTLCSNAQLPCTMIITHCQLGQYLSANHIQLSEKCLVPESKFDIWDFILKFKKKSVAATVLALSYVYV